VLRVLGRNDEFLRIHQTAVVVTCVGFSKGLNATARADITARKPAILGAEAHEHAMRAREIQTSAPESPQGGQFLHRHLDQPCPFHFMPV
jgi:hypothetical protein